MTSYFCAFEPDLRCYPNYSFEIGDVNGDGRSELVSLNQNGNRLRAVNLDGDVLLERKLQNNGNWGTAPICLTDVNADGREEMIVPSFGPRFEARIVAYDIKGAQVLEHSFGSHCRDDYGICIPLLAPFRYQRQGPRGAVAAVAGGRVVGMDAKLSVLWAADGFRNDFGHEFHIADIDGDGLDEIAFCTLNHINGGFSEDGWNVGEFVLLDHDGTTIFRKDIQSYHRDTHFDDVAMCDFRGRGEVEILFEKGLLVDLHGDVIWDVSKELDHGQWIAHTENPHGLGRLIFISELWGEAGKSALFSSEGEKLMDVSDLPWTVLDQNRFPGYTVLPTRCHIFQWTPGSAPEIFLGEQVCSPTSHDCFVTTYHELKCFFLSLDGRLLGTLPFKDALIEGYWYNGEVRSRVADVDGDGQQEVVFPRQDGRVMTVKRRV